MIYRSKKQIEQIKKDLEKKIVFISGPRQVGKTTLSKLLTSNFDYLNFDIIEDRAKIIKQDWNWNKEVIIFDELHKKTKWKSWLKGIYDREVRPHLLVTGSAKLNTYKKVGDSLAGRFFEHRLHPLDLKELKGQGNSKENFQKLLKQGGFPEAFTSLKETDAARFRKSHLDVILRQDLIDLETVKNITGIETLIALMKDRVGGGISFSSLARDLEVDPKTVKNWIRILEDLYVIFSVRPYSSKITRSILKEPKVYFFDNGQVKADEGARFENLVATALLKEIHLMEDLYGVNGELFYLRNKEKIEVDFLVVIDRRPVLLVEAKMSDTQVTPSLAHYSQYFKENKINPNIKSVQLVANFSETKKNKNGIEVSSAIRWLENIDFKNISES